MSVRDRAEATVAAATFAVLRRLRMTTVFGCPLHTGMPPADGWPPDIRFVAALQEASAVAMADGYAQASGRPALVAVDGPGGLGGGLGSLYTASCHRTPLVVLSGRPARFLPTGEPYPEPLVTGPFVKWSGEAARPQDVPAVVAVACRRALQPPRGPALVWVPDDAWWAPAGPEPPPIAEAAGTVAAETGALCRVADAIRLAERPALVAGPAVDADGAWDDTIELAERTRATVWASPAWSRAGFPEHHPQFAGFLSPVPWQLIEQLAGHDVVVVLGARAFTPVEPGSWPPAVRRCPTALPARLFHLTDDPDAAAWAFAGESVLCSVGLGVRDLLDLTGESSRRPPVPRSWPQPPAVTDPMSQALVFHRLAAALPADAIIVEELASGRDALHEHVRIASSGGYYATGSGAPGSALPAAVGIALAQPSRRVVALVGGGSATRSIQALWTAAAHRLRVTVVVLGSAGCSAGMDMVALARGHGCAGRRVESAAELPEALAAALRADGPVLLDVPVASGGISWR